MNHPSNAPMPTAGGPNFSRARRLLTALQVIQVRLRFIALLVVLGLVIGRWETLKNYWDRWTRRAFAAEAAHADEEFYCPMHPGVVRSAAGNCPICGMPLSKRKTVVALRVELPEGVLSRKQYTPYRIAQAGIRTVEVSYQPLIKEITALGAVTYDDTRRRLITSRTSGFVEALHVAQNGVAVKADEPLAEIYSPELFRAAQELRIAAQRNRNDALADAARQKLRAAGVAETQIAEIERGSDTGRRILLRSPLAGRVVAKNVVLGQALEAGAALYEVADLSTVWLEAQVYEKDVAFAQEGRQVEATTEAFPGTVFRGRVALVLPQFDAATRTNTVRIAMENPDDSLRPGMYASVRLRIPVAELPAFAAATQHRNAAALSPPSDDAGPIPGVLAIPREAVIDTGTQKVAYVERQPGLFEGVAVELGPRAGDYYAVLKGLAPGDRVAAAGAFLLDAETRLNPAAAATYFGAGGRSNNPSTPERDNSSEPASPQNAPTLMDNITALPPPDRQIALRQKTCPVSGSPLGSMGVPHLIMLKDHRIFLCCRGCTNDALAHADDALRKALAPAPPAEAAQP